MESAQGTRGPGRRCPLGNRWNSGQCANEQENCAHEQSGKEKTHLSPSEGSFYFVSALGNK